MSGTKSERSVSLARVSQSPATIAILAGVAMFVLVVTLDFFAALRAPIGLVLLAFVWIALPTARGISRRLALNGAIGLGVIPVLWWLPWLLGQVSHSSIILGVPLGLVTFLIVRGAETRGTLVPHFSVVDLIPAAAALFSAWFFLPFFHYTKGLASISLLRGAFGNDNVAHFDMFEMIRRTLAVGPIWPRATDGSAPAYVNYPQHFHVLVAFAAELWGGPKIGSLGSEVGLYGIGTSIVLSIALITLVAAICSLRAFRTRPVLALIAGSAAMSFLLLGFGSVVLSFGFPGYLLAIIGIVIVIVLAIERGSAPTIDVLAAGALVVMVANSWALLTPLAVVALVVVIVRLLRFDHGVIWRAVAPGTVIALLTVGGVAYAGFLVLAATGDSGSPENALATGGASPVIPVALAVLPAFLTLIASGAFTVAAVVGRGRRFALKRTLGGVGVLGISAGLGILEGGVLVLIQLRHSPHLSYFQYKFFDSLFLIFAVLFVLTLCSKLAEFGRFAIAVSRGPKRLASAALSLAVVTGILLAAGIPLGAADAGQGFQIAGMRLRADLATQARAADEGTKRLLAASNLMALLPCPSPIYVAPLRGDLNMGAAAQWAMSFSSRWGNGTAGVVSYLFEFDGGIAPVNVSALIQRLLEGQSKRCVIVAPQVLAKLSPRINREYGARVFSWQ